MGRKQKLIYALSGFALGVLLTCGVWLCVKRGRFSNFFIEKRFRFMLYLLK